MKKALSLFMSIVMLISITAGTKLNSYAMIASSGSCGTNATYTFFEPSDSINTLKISGSGAIANSAFFNENQQYFNLIIEEGITSIGSYAFCGSGVKHAYIPKSVTSISAHAFGYNSIGKSIVILNPNCTFENEAIYSSNYGTIYGYANSTAQKFAEANSLSFESIDGYDCSTGNHIKVFNGFGYECVLCQQAVVCDESKHDWYSQKTTTEPTCTSNGIVTYYCSACNTTKTEEIPAKGHNFGENNQTCKDCGEINPNYVAPTQPTTQAPTTTKPTTQTPTTQAQPTTQPTAQQETTTTTTAEATTKKPKSTSIKKLTKGKKSFKATWKKITGVNGYQIQYSTDNKFKKNTKTATIKKNTASTTVKKLKANKKYYVRVRSYKNAKVGSKTVKVYSSWSKVKTVKTK